MAGTIEAWIEEVTKGMWPDVAAEGRSLLEKAYETRRPLEPAPYVPLDWRRMEERLEQAGRAAAEARQSEDHAIDQARHARRTALEDAAAKLETAAEQWPGSGWLANKGKSYRDAAELVRAGLASTGAPSLADIWPGGVMVLRLRMHDVTTPAWGAVSQLDGHMSNGDSPRAALLALKAKREADDGD